MTMIMSAEQTTPTTTQPEGDKPLISSLKSQIAHLEVRRDLWDRWYFWLVAGTAALIAATVVVQLVSRSVNGRLSSAQAQLIAEKDRQLTIDLKAKDEEIQRAKETASKADERAGIANKSAGEANRAAGDAKERAAKLEVEAADARKEQERLALATEELRKSNTESAERLESEKKKRLQLAVSLLPRECLYQLFIAEALKSATDFSARIEFLDESEPRDLAEQLNFIFLQAGWSNVFGVPLHESVFDGVLVMGTSGTPPQPPKQVGTTITQGLPPGFAKYIADMEPRLCAGAEARMR